MPLDAVRNPRLILIWGGALLAALWLAATAVGAVAKTRAPELALAMSPRNGFAYEQQAALHVFAGKASLQGLRVAEGDAALARQALRREPLASGALAIVGLDKASRGARDEAEKAFALVNRLDKRQPVANAWLIDHHGTAGRSREVLRLLDEALKVNPELAQQYMPALAQALAQPDTIDFFQALLRRDPAWEPRFWDVVAATPAALANAEELRSRILRQGVEKPGEIDRNLVAAFVGAHRFDLAVGFARRLAPAGQGDGLVRDGSFTRIPELPPLDWDLRIDGRIGAALDLTRGALEMNALQGAGGLVARQLIDAPPGDYQLLAKLATATLGQGSDVVIRLHCAQQGAPGGVSLLERVTGDVEKPFTVPGGGCRYHWLDIEFSAMDASGPAMASLAEVRIVSARPTG